MKDAEYLFNETSRERKSVARSAKYKKGRGGRYVRMPHDRMTKGELEKMNGEVKSYSMGKPIGWADFLAMPHDVQNEYLNGIVKKFPNLPAVMIAEMLGVNNSTMSSYMSVNGIKIEREKGHKKTRADRFVDTEEGMEYLAWACGEKKPVIDVEPVIDEKPVIDREPVKVEVKEKSEPIEVKSGLDVNNIAVLLKSLVGSGAKLTIEIVL